MRRIQQSLQLLQRLKDMPAWLFTSPCIGKLLLPLRRWRQVTQAAQQNSSPVEDSLACHQSTPHQALPGAWPAAAGWALLQRP